MKETDFWRDLAIGLGIILIIILIVHLDPKLISNWPDWPQ